MREGGPNILPESGFRGGPADCCGVIFLLFFRRFFGVVFGRVFGSF